VSLPSGCPIPASFGWRSLCLSDNRLSSQSPVTHVLSRPSPTPVKPSRNARGFVSLDTGRAQSAKPPPIFDNSKVTRAGWTARQHAN
jgi:hypothetical protein